MKGEGRYYAQLLRCQNEGSQTKCVRKAEKAGKISAEGIFHAPMRKEEGG